MHRCVNVNICKFAILGPIFMNFSPNCRAMELGMLFTILRSFCSFLDREGGPDIPPQNRPWKNPCANYTIIKFTVKLLPLFPWESVRLVIKR